MVLETILFSRISWEIPNFSSENSFSAAQELIPSCNSSIASKSNPFEDGSKNLEKLIAAILIFVQVWSPLPLFGLDSAYISPAEAVLYSPDTKVPRSGELALRRAIPANPNMKAIQACHSLRLFQLVDCSDIWFLKLLILLTLLCVVSLGVIGRYIISSENSSKKALWYHGEQCKESSKGKLRYICYCLYKLLNSVWLMLFCA